MLNPDRVVVGAIVWFILGTVLSMIDGYGVSEAMGTALTFFFASVVCTVGITLIAWGPIFYMTGSVVYRLLGIHKPPRLTTWSRTAPTSPVDPNLVALANYVTAAKAAGMSRDDIRATLQQKGWAEAQISGILSSA